VAAGLVVLATSFHAHAEEYPPCGERTPTAQDVDAAKGMHKAAEQYYAKAKYDQAITSWREAYNFDCNAHRLLINVGNAYEKLGNTAKAIEAFDAYVQRLGPNADPTIVEKVANLKALLAQQQKPPEGNGNDAPPPDPNPDPNPSPDEPPVDGGDTTTSLAPWILVGTGGAVAVVGGVLIGVGFGKVNEAEDRCPTHQDCDNESTSLGNEGLTLQRVGGVMFGLGLAAVAGGVVWYLIDSGAFSGDDPQAAALPVNVGVAVTPEFSGVSLSGSF
jgi:tetratricopeptide (TPR) repeat protein